ncbi:MAG: ATP-binding protein [Planctomycetota bacterium]
MNFLSVKHRITLGLVCLLCSSMVIVYFTGLGPNQRAAEMHGRAQLCESLAVQTSMLTNPADRARLKNLLESIVERNDEIISIGLVRNTGQQLIDIEDHFAQSMDGMKLSTETFVRVPLRQGGQKWSELQIRFLPIGNTGWLGWLLSPLTIYVCLVAMACFVSFSLFLGKVLQQLDPSNAVPRRVKTALDTLAEGLIVTDRKGRVLLANETFSNWSGVPADNLVGKHSAKFPWIWNSEADQNSIADRDAADQTLPWDLALQMEAPQAGRLMTLRHHDGRELTLVANSSPVLGAEGDYRGVLTSFEDVTDLERHKVELSQAKLDADRANSAKSEFLARMSHEIRTPMNAILGYTEVLQFGMEEDPAKRQQHLTTIQSSGEHLLSLINDILDLSKIESGQLELEKTKISLHQLISQVVSVLKIKAVEKGINLVYEPSGLIPTEIYTDGVRLKQAIINLIGNAIKFTDEGGVLIQPKLIEVNGKTMLDISIADTGIGMTQEAIEKVFEPFAQADMSITRRFGGTGLGLSICKELAEKLGGQVTVSSNVGQGSVFSFQFDPGDLTGVPLVEPDKLEEFANPESEASRQFQLPGAKVLIVDDGESNRELVALFLKRAHIDFEMAVNGQEAVDCVMANEFDAVLMDMQMPVMDGFAATRRLREIGCETPIIALTANAMAQDERRCRDAGCSGFLPKPIKREKLYNSLADALPQFMPSYVEVTSKNETVTHPPAGPTVEKFAAFDEEADVSAGQTEPGKYIESSLPMDDEDFIHIARLFTEQLHRKIQLMETAAESSDFTELFNLGHWLKGAGGSAGFDAFNQPGKQIETAATAHDDIAIQQLIEQLREMATRIRVVPAGNSSPNKLSSSQHSPTIVLDNPTIILDQNAAVPLP